LHAIIGPTKEIAEALDRKHDREVLRIHQAYQVIRRSFLERHRVRSKAVKESCILDLKKLHCKYRQEKEDLCAAHESQLSEQDNIIKDLHKLATGNSTLAT
jgi:hypothetical protein